MVDTDLIKDFVADSLDLLDSVEPKLIELQQACAETGKTDPAAVNAVFRLFHSLKGTAGFLALNNMVSLTHAAETLLELLRTGKLLLTAGVGNLLFRALDFNRTILTYVAEHNSDSGFENEVAAMVAELSEQIHGKASPSCAEEAAEPVTASEPKPVLRLQAEPVPSNGAGCSDEPAPAEFEIPITPDMIDSFVKEAGDLIDQFEQSLLKIDEGQGGELVPDAFRAIHSFKGNCGFMGLADLGRLSHKMESVLELIKEGAIAVTPQVIRPLLTWVDVLRDGVADVAKGGKGSIANCDLLIELIDDNLAKTPVVKNVPPPDRLKVERIVEEPGGDAGKAKRPSEADAGSPADGHPVKTVVRQDIRVDLSKLDSLINLVGELVIAEAMVTRHPAITLTEDNGLERAIHQLRRVSRDLQGVAMSVRMIPLAGTFQKMVRLVHDLSAKSGKKVELQLLGEDTEVDKTVIEQIGDPLVHLVRNAVDHGLELPEERLSHDKPGEGRLTIEGRHEGGEVWVIIRDDGRGLNRERILKKAIEKGLLNGDGKELSDQQVFKFIFEPGFSTADKVTDVSGRGVGMDVVKRNIEKLKGRIDISSSPGRGATFIMRIPLTLAIIEGMLVRVGNTCYTIPMLVIRESIRPLAQHITVTSDGQEIVRMREEFLPVIRLHQVFHRKPEHDDLPQGILVVVETEGRSVALFVDEIIGQQETVIKGLSGYLAKARGISGCTILGDGQVSLILDVGALVAQAAQTGAPGAAPPSAQIIM